MTRAPGGRADKWCRTVLIIAGLTLVLAALVSGWSDQRRGPQRGALPGLEVFFGRVAGGTGRTPGGVGGHRGQAGRRARVAGCYREVPPFLGGWLAPLVAVTGVFEFSLQTGGPYWI
jgi:hypothetical protein